MKLKTGNTIRLGIFVSAGIFLFILGIYYIGQRRQLFNSKFKVTAIFKDIGGLQVGNNVRFSGINVGIVDMIQQITDSSVQVDMYINERTRKFIKKNASAIIGSDGLMGNKLVTISPGFGTMHEITNNDTIATEVPTTIDDILKKVKVTSDNVADITDDLAAMTDNIRQGKGTIGKLFFDSAFAVNLDRTMDNIKKGAGGFKNNMDAASHNFLLRGFLKKKEKKEKKEKEQLKKDAKAERKAAKRESKGTK